MAFGNLSCDSARFEAAVTLQDTECLGGFWCNAARFDGRVDLRGLEVHGRTWLRGASGEKGPEALLREITAYGFSWT